jgi:hypothetical protein
MSVKRKQNLINNYNFLSLNIFLDKLGLISLDFAVRVFSEMIMTFIFFWSSLESITDDFREFLMVDVG